MLEKIPPYPGKDTAQCGTCNVIQFSVRERLGGEIIEEVVHKLSLEKQVD